MAGWGFEEPFATAIDAIANEINRSADAQNWKDILTNNSFDTVGSLQVLNSADWVSLGIPLRVLIELRKRAIHNPDKLVPKEKKLSVDLKSNISNQKSRENSLHYSSSFFIEIIMNEINSIQTKMINNIQTKRISQIDKIENSNNSHNTLSRNYPFSYTTSIN